MIKVNYLYYITLISSIFLSSCVKTESDAINNPTPPDPNNPVVTLTNEYLAGYWVIFYNSKRYKNNETESMGTSYRYPDIEGREIYYSKNGDFKEYNAWGNVLVEGKYTIKLKSKDSERDSIIYNFHDYEKDIDTITMMSYPMVTEKYFDRYNYYGRENKKTKQKFYIGDTWYLRRVDSTYEPPELPKINNISPESILGTWKFNSYIFYSYGSKENKPYLNREIGMTYKFNLDKTFVKHNALRDSVFYGKYFIIDDVVQLMRKDTVLLANGKDSISAKTEFFWIKNPIQTSNSGTSFIRFNEYKDVNDLTNVITTEFTYLKE